MVAEQQATAELLLDLPHAQAWCADSRDLSFIEDRSVHLVVTSPPYLDRIAYSGGNGSQLGNIHEYERFRVELEAVWAEVARVIVPGGMVCVNLPALYGSDDEGMHALIPAPVDVVVFFRGLGFHLVEWIVWEKFTGIRANNRGDRRRMFGSYPLPGYLYTTEQYEPIVCLRAPGKRQFDGEARRASTLSREEWLTLSDQIWPIVSLHDRNHPATWPEEIPSRLIRMYTTRGETVLDPFAGVGTSIVAAAKLGRRGLGVDCSAAYAAEMARRCSQLVMLT